MKTLLRSAAIAVASTALVAGGATTATAAPGDSANIVLPPITLGSFKGSTSTFVPVTLQTSRPTLSSVRATVNVNGAPVASGVFVSGSGFLYQQAWGAGVVTLTGLTDFSNSPVAGGSNPADVRYGVEASSRIKVTKKGKKLTFRLRARYIDNTGAAVPLRKATIQVKKGSRWKTLKNVKLKRNGTATYKRSDRKKRSYRMLIKDTSIVRGGNTSATRRL